MINHTRTENIEQFFKNILRFDGKLGEGDRDYIPWITERLMSATGPWAKSGDRR